MLHTKFRGSQCSGSREQIWKSCNRILAWWPSWPCDPGATTNFRSSYPWRLQMKFGFDSSSDFGEDTIMDADDNGRRTDERQSMTAQAN